MFTWLDVHKFQDKHATDIVGPKIDPWKEEQAQEHLELTPRLLGRWRLKRTLSPAVPKATHWTDKQTMIGDISDDFSADVTLTHIKTSHTT